jgi:aryl-alcohol dehydrogenase-like predicted oxidoreductase
MTEFPFVLGAIPFGTTVDEHTSFAIMDRFVAAGGTTIDTANNYPYWLDGCTGDESELTIGRWLAGRGDRDTVRISTKMGARPRTPGARTLAGAEGLGAQTIGSAIEGSLRRLGTDHVDVYWAHVEDRSVPLAETIDAFHRLVEQGKVGELGASNLPAWRLERARSLAAAQGWTPYTHVQLRHSYLRPRPDTELKDGGHTLVTDDMLDYVRTEPDLTLWVYNALMAGGYVRADKPIDPAYDHPGTTRRLETLRAVSADLGVTPNQVVLAWLAGGDPACRPIVGASTLAQLEETIAAADLKLDPDVRDRLDAAS